VRALSALVSGVRDSVTRFRRQGHLVRLKGRLARRAPARVGLGTLIVVVAATPSHVRAGQESRPSFSEFIAVVRTEALQRGIRQEIVDEALSNIEEPVPVVIERDRSQAETVLSLEAYLTRRLTPALVRSGREALARQRPLLDEVSGRYGVPPEVIVAIWGLESDFGGFTGVRPTVAALATLAWDPRRSAFFRSELFAALEILNRGDIEVSRMRGSWAGAMGQLQFMPTSYLQFAEDFDGDGRRDIWSSAPDIFASVGNYLKGKGWIADQAWGREVRVPEDAAGRIAGTVARRTGTCQAKRDMTVALPIAEWRRLGVRLPGGHDLPDDLPEAALVSGRTRHFLVHHNYDAILDYNCAHSYAIAVGLLAARVNGDDPLPASKTAKRQAARPAKKKRPSPGSARRSDPRTP
jgi:membrane-bound lytic murein transglycosylase B